MVYYSFVSSTEDLDGEIKFGKILGIYSHPEPGRETVTIHGPTNEDLIFYVSKQNSKLSFQEFFI